MTRAPEPPISHGATCGLRDSSRTSKASSRPSYFFLIAVSTICIFFTNYLSTCKAIGAHRTSQHRPHHRLQRDHLQDCAEPRFENGAPSLSIVAAYAHAYKMWFFSCSTRQSPASLHGSLLGATHTFMPHLPPRDPSRPTRPFARSDHRRQPLLNVLRVAFQGNFFTARTACRIGTPQALTSSCRPSWAT